MSRQIKQLDNQQSTNSPLVPSQPFSMFLVGSIGEGKTTCLVNLVTNNEFYRQKFNRIIYVSVTADLDEKCKIILQDPKICVSNQALQDAYDDKMLAVDEDHQRTKLPRFCGINDEDVYETYEPSILENLRKHQKSHIIEFGKEKADKVLVIFDDAISSGCYSGSQKAQTMFGKWMTQLRHLKCSIIHVSQQFKACPKVIRGNSTCLLICGTPGDLEVHDIYETFGAGLSSQKWKELLYIITSKPFQPFVVNLKNKRGCKIQRSFEEFVG